jgi:hypothetical protein
MPRFSNLPKPLAKQNCTFEPTQRVLDTPKEHLTLRDIIHAQLYWDIKRMDRVQERCDKVFATFERWGPLQSSSYIAWIPCL